MSDASRDNNVINRITGFILVVISIAIFIGFFKIVRMGRYKDDSVKITGRYDVTFNGEVYEDVDLATKQFPSIKKGDHVTYSFVMPDSYVDDAVLTIYLDHAAVKVYYDDELVYEKGSPKSRMLGYGNVSIPLPDDYKGINVRVEIDAIENEGLSSLSQPVINNARTLLHNYNVDLSLYLVIDIAIVMLCITIVLLSFIFSRLLPALRHLAYFGMAFFLMGLYELCSYDMLKIFSDSLVFRGYLEYSSLYLGPFFLTLYFYKEFFRHETELIRKIYRVILVLQGVFPVVAFTLHFTDIMHLPEVLTVCHVLLLTNVVTVLVVLIRRVLRKDNTHRYMVFGLIILILLSIADMVRFNLYIRLMREKMHGYVSYLLVGFFLFLIAMIIDFFVNQRKRLYKAAHAEAMAKLALIDMMTNLANRRGCENAFDAIRKNNKIFGIICIDINFLKLTNDKYGHQEGDKLLVDFAGLLTSACEGMECTVGRMGGDEFTVIVPEADNEKLESIIETLNAKRDEINVSRTPMPISFAYGFCLSDDAELEGHTSTGDIVELVYQIADERMYQNKVAMKARREDVSDGV